MRQDKKTKYEKKIYLDENYNNQKDNEISYDPSYEDSNFSQRGVIRRGRNREKTKVSTQVIHDNIVVRNGKICKKTIESKKEKYQEIAKNIEIVSIFKVLETGEIKYKLQTLGLEDEVVSFEISRSHLASKEKLKELSSKGADIFDYNLDIIVKHLVNEEARKKANGVELVHGGIGWFEHDKKMIFRHYHSVGIKSKYIGSLEIKPKGTLEGWKEIVQQEVIGNHYLELACIIGMSSAIVSYLSKEYSLDSLFFNIVGDSSKGKTTAGQLAVSCGGYPGTDKVGLMSTWNATKNAIIGSLSGNMGCTCFFDELSVSNTQKFSDFIYLFASGNDKKRMNKEGQVKSSEGWGTTIISTGEIRMTSSSNQNTGQKVRIVEITDIQWTKSAENSNNIKNGVIKHYGHATPLIAQELLSRDKDEVAHIFEDCKKICIDKMDKNDIFADRVSKIFAVIIMTAKLAREALDLDFDCEKIIDILVENEKNNESKDIAKVALDYLQEQIQININKFVQFKGNRRINSPNGEVWGCIKYENTENSEKLTKIEYLIIPHIMKKILSEGGFSDENIILNRWKERKILIHDKDHLTKKRKIDVGRKAVRVYVVHEDFKDVREDIEKNEDNVINIRRRKKTITQKESLVKALGGI